MKDRQVPHTPAPPRIPFVSAVLHCVSMSVVVFLRSGFGYAYLRPRSIFFASSYAFGLFLIYAWNEPGVWEKTAEIRYYGLSVVGLYVLHLIAAFFGEFLRDWNGIMALSTLASLPLVVIFVLFQKRVIQGLSSGAIK